MMELSYIRSVDRQFSEMNKSLKAFYFKSDDRDVIADVINNSATLRGWLRKEYKVDNEKGYESLVVDKVIEEIDVIKGVGDFAGKESNAKIFVIKDFGIHKEEAAAMWIKAVLDGCKNALLFLSGNVVNIPHAFSDEVKLIEVPSLDVGDIKIPSPDAPGRGRVSVPGQETSRGQALLCLHDGRLQQVPADLLRPGQRVHGKARRTS